MHLQPRSTKYRKTRKRRQNTKFEFKANKLSFGEIGLKSTVSGTITARQIEAARQSITRKIKRKGKIWIKIFPHMPVTSKPTESRMGKGKGYRLIGGNLWRWLFFLTNPTCSLSY